MQLLGIDAGTSSIKVSVLDGNSDQRLASAMHPSQEMRVMAAQPGWAEQSSIRLTGGRAHTQQAIREMLQASGVKPAAIGAIGIAYQMHGLVLCQLPNDG
jgi:xylulokinase